MSDVGKTFHLCIDLRGALKHFRPKEWRGVMSGTDGHLMTPDEVKSYFLDRLAEGKRVIPCGPCDGFDYQTGCPGHPAPPPTPLPEWASPYLNRSSRP